MTTPGLYSDVAVNAYQTKVERDGAVTSIKATAAIPATTVITTNVGMVRFQKGFFPTHLAIKSADLDTSTNVTLDVGYIYDDTIQGTDDDNFFFNDLDIAQDAGSRTWPIDDGLGTGVSFTATGSGYISITTAGGSTTTAGNIEMIVTYTYNASLST